MILGVGMDIVHVNPIKKSMKRFGGRYLDKIFTPAEQEYCNARRLPAKHYAARFAAREAFIKACGPRLSRPGQVMKNIEVVLDERGCPGLRLHGATDDDLGPDVRVHVSLTHDNMVAGAVAVIESIE